MNRNLWLGILIVVLILVGGYYFGKGYSSPAANMPKNSASSSSTKSSSQSLKVDISNFIFNPSSTTVKINSTVTWTNNDSAPHTVTSDNGNFQSNTLATGDTFSFTFKKAGTFPYHCNIHKFMKAEVIVTP